MITPSNEFIPIYPSEVNQNNGYSQTREDGVFQKENVKKAYQNRILNKAFREIAISCSTCGSVSPFQNCTDIKEWENTNHYVCRGLFTKILEINDINTIEMNGYKLYSVNLKDGTQITAEKGIRGDIKCYHTIPIEKGNLNGRCTSTRLDRLYYKKIKEWFKVKNENDA